MQNINAMDNNDDNKNMQWQKHVVETILFTGKQYNFRLQTTYSSCLKKKKESARCLHSTKILLGIITLKKNKNLMQPLKNIQWYWDEYRYMFVWNSFMFLQTDDWLMQWSKDKCDASSQNEFFWYMYNKHNRGKICQNSSLVWIWYSIMYGINNLKYSMLIQIHILKVSLKNI